MTETKKDFKDWDISDFDFAHAESLADQPLRRDHIPFYGFNKVPKGEPRPQFPKHYPTSNLADVLVYTKFQLVCLTQKSITTWKS